MLSCVDANCKCINTTHLRPINELLFSLHFHLERLKAEMSRLLSKMKATVFSLLVWVRLRYGGRTGLTLLIVRSRALRLSCSPTSLISLLPSTDQRYLRKLQIRARKWKPTGIGPCVVTTLHGMAEQGFPESAQSAAQMGNPNLNYGPLGREQELCLVL